MSDSSPWRRLSHAPLSRRSFLRAGGIAGLGSAGFALVGCGGGGDDQPPAQTPEEAAEQAAEEAASEEATPETPGEETAEPATPVTPTAGGVARFPTQNDSNNHDRWDPHRSRFSQTQLWHGLMYNRLIRWDSIAAGTLQPDLCNLPEMPDEVTYIFTVRPEARFWDLPPTNGRAFTAQDIRFNIQRQIEGLGADSNPDPLFFRQPDYIRTAAMEVTGDRSIVLSTDGPDSTYLASVHAGPWAWMTSPEAVAEFGADWRNDAGNIQLNSGTGPYVPVSFLGGQNLVLKRSTNWWKPNSAYPDGWIFQHASAADAQQLYLGKQLDLVAAPLGKLAVEALRAEFPVHASFDLPVQTPIQLGFVFTDDPDNPLRDPRLARALSLAVDRFELIDRLYLGDGRLSGPVPWFFGEWAIPEADLLALPGYRPDKEQDLADIQQLVDAAGGAAAIAEIRLALPDLFQGFFPGIAEAVKAMIERNSGLTLKIESPSYADLFQQVQDGGVPAFFGLGPVPLSQMEADPTSFWLRTAYTDAPENWGRYSNPDVDALLDQMRITFDQPQRRALARQVQDLLLNDPFWLQNVTNGIQLGVNWPFLHLDPRLFEFAWAGHHLDQAWVDTTHADYPSDRTLPELPAEGATPEGAPGETPPPNP